MSKKQRARKGKQEKKPATSLVQLSNDAKTVERIEELKVSKRRNEALRIAGKRGMM